jgi:cystathionine beta-lyase
MEAMAELEGAAGARLFSSGLAAVTGTLTALLSSGDELLAADCVYGPIRRFCDGLLKGYGVTTCYFPADASAEAVLALAGPATRMILLESPGSLTFEIQDIPAIAALARSRGIVTAIDNTWGAGLLFAPLGHGVDISLQALTKYVGGHSDLILGAVTVNSDEDWAWLRDGALQMGAYASPDDCWLALRGLRTLAVRLKAHEAAALRVAKWFSTRPEVARVLHPALPGCPGHEIFKRDFAGACGLFSVVFQPEFSAAAVVAMIDALKLFGIGASWGGFESLIQPAAPPRTATRWQAAGPLVRVHIGLEDPQDLIADLEQGLGKLRAAA